MHEHPYFNYTKQCRRPSHTSACECIVHIAQITHDPPPHSSTIFASALADESTNIYSALSESVTSSNSSANEPDSFASSSEPVAVGPPLATSSPKRTANGPEPKPKQARNIKILNMNCQSIKHKKHELATIIDSSDPDIIMFTETWLHPNTKNKEFLPDNYEAHRRDRPGGVLLAINKELRMLTTTHLTPSWSLLMLQSHHHGSSRFYPDSSTGRNLDEPGVDRDEPGWPVTNRDEPWITLGRPGTNFKRWDMFDNLVEPASNRGENSNLLLTWKNRVLTWMNRNEP